MVILFIPLSKHKSGIPGSRSRHVRRCASILGPFINLEFLMNTVIYIWEFSMLKIQD